MRRCTCFLACASLIGGMFLALFAARDSTPDIVRPPVLIVILDASYSMTASCGSSSRIAVAKNCIRRIVNFCDTAEIALVTFRGEAMLDVPPTSDKEAFFTALSDVEPTFAASQGSNPATALTLAEAVSHGRSALAVLFTDGEEQHASSATILTASERTLPLAWCAIGTGPAVPMPLGTSWLRDPDTHEIALTRAHPKALETFAKVSTAPQLCLTAEDDGQSVRRFMQDTLRDAKASHDTLPFDHKLAICVASLGGAVMMLLWLSCSRLLLLPFYVMLTTAPLLADTHHELNNDAVVHLQQALAATDPATAQIQLRRARLLVAEALRNQPDCIAAQHNLRIIVLLEQRWRTQQLSEVVATQQTTSTDEALPLAGEPGLVPLQDTRESLRSSGTDHAAAPAVTADGKTSAISPASSAGTAARPAATGSWRHILKREQSMKKRSMGFKPW